MKDNQGTLRNRKKPQILGEGATEKEKSPIRKGKKRNNSRNEEEQEEEEEEEEEKGVLKKETPLHEQRLGGDGESESQTPPNERNHTTPEGVNHLRNKDHEDEEEENPFKISISVDVMAIFLLASGLLTRFTYLDRPRNIVFDEMHYAKYANMYLKRTFFFDSNPPLGKMMIAGAAYASGYTGNFTFDKIGATYPDDLPISSFRAVPAFCGSTLSPLVYLILSELGLSTWSGLLAGFMVLFDTALLTQSRYVLLEAIMMMFSLMAVLAAVKLRKSKSFSPWWCFWFFLTVTFMSLALCVKYLGIYSMFLCGWILFREFWKRLKDKSVSDLRIFFEMVFQVVFVIVIPITLYIGIFYVHLGILNKAGVHDSLMTSAFQASLEGGLSSIIKGQPSIVAHGSQVTLRHTHGKTCWLHSHEHVYPVRYSDNRGSSHQQQVSCYGYKDVNNWWIVKRPEREDLAVHEPLDVIRDGDVIQLVHGLTHRALNSHDVAAPMSPLAQEISCYIDYNISMSSENLWRVEIANAPSSGEKIWYTIGSQVRLIHKTTGRALKFSGKLYGDWGFYQNEVVADKVISQLDAVWNVEEHRYTKNDEDKKSIERELITSELIPTTPTKMSFIEKFLELQAKMLITDQENVQNHNYASGPIEWPFLKRGIAYFIAKNSNAQVHLLGNVVTWLSGTVAVMTYAVIFGLYLLRRQRLCFDIPEGHWNKFLSVSEVLLVGYGLHYIPFFFYDRTLFLHHYLPGYLFKIMITSYVIHHIHSLLYFIFPSFRIFRIAYVILILIWCGGIIYSYLRLSVLSYGIHPLTALDVKSLRWIDSWDLIIHKP